MTAPALHVVPRTSDTKGGAPSRGPGEGSAKPAHSAAVADRAAFGDLLRWPPALLPLPLQSAGARGPAAADLPFPEPR